MDADIRLESARANDFKAFLVAHPKIQLIAFNGKKAEQLFKKFVDTRSIDGSIRQIGLPSTSPAYAALSFSGKLRAWREAIQLSVAE
jgi:hypoxanthine-DNA glycosylase